MLPAASLGGQLAPEPRLWARVLAQAQRHGWHYACWLVLPAGLCLHLHPVIRRISPGRCSKMYGGTLWTSDWPQTHPARTLVWQHACSPWLALTSDTAAADSHCVLHDTATMLVAPQTNTTIQSRRLSVWHCLYCLRHSIALQPDPCTSFVIDAGGRLALCYLRH
jgi:hypothetical protein